MNFTVTESGGGRFNTATEGQHVAKFLGVSDMPTVDKDGKPIPKKRGTDGKEMEPGMAWEFEIADGPDAGKVSSRITGKTPTPKNMAGRFLAALTGKQLKPGASIDLGACVGKLYLITVERNGDRTRLAEIPAPTPYHGGSPAPAPSAGGPPPRRQAGKPAGPAFYWVETNPDADPVQVPAAELRAFFAKNQLDGRTVLVCPDGGTEYKPACEFDTALVF